MDPAEALRALPRTDDLLAHEALAPWPRSLARDAVREALEAARQAARAGEAPDAGAIVDEAVARLEAWTTPAKRPVINATGVVLHTNLGRAPWLPAAVDAAARAAGGYTDLEVRLEDGHRGGRLAGVRERLCRLTGAEDAVVVNNAAAAVLLALTALARDREVVCSRGELVEIGGSFRVPDVVASGGARLVAVGTTNRTRRADVEQAVGPHTAVLLHVHPSNFRVVGFTASLSVAELVSVARAHDLAVVADLGSGALVPRGDEPVVGEAVAAGADVVAFSGDKLLGGPQAGILVGRSEAIARLRRHPLYRALRLDKSLLAALDVTLIAHLRGEGTRVDAMLDADPATLRATAEAWATRLREHGVDASVVDAEGRTGGGTMPAEVLPGAAVRIAVDDAEAAARALRTGDPAVLATIRDHALHVHPRAVADEEVEGLLSALASVAGLR